MLLECKANTNKSSKNNYTEKKFSRLASFCPIMLVTILVTAPVDKPFLSG